MPVTTISGEGVEFTSISAAADAHVLKTGAPGIVIVPAPADAGVEVNLAAENLVAVNGRISASLAAVHVNATVVHQVGAAAGITAVDTNGEVIAHPIIEAHKDCAGSDVVPV